VAEDMSAVRYRVPAFSLAVAGAAAVRCPFGSVVRERRADPAAVVEDLSGSPAVRARSGVHALIRRWVGVPGGCRRDRDWVPEHRTAARRYRADISPQGGPRTESAIRAHHRPRTYVPHGMSASRTSRPAQNGIPVLPWTSHTALRVASGISVPLAGRLGVAAVFVPRPLARQLVV
jgi:hypothetical protein